MKTSHFHVELLPWQLNITKHRFTIKHPVTASSCDRDSPEQEFVNTQVVVTHRLKNNALRYCDLHVPTMQSTKLQFLIFWLFHECNFVYFLLNIKLAKTKVKKLFSQYVVSICKYQLGMLTCIGRDPEEYSSICIIISGPTSSFIYHTVLGSTGIVLNSSIIICMYLFPTI